LAKNEAPASSSATAPAPAPHPGSPVDLNGFRTITAGDQIFAQELVATFIRSGEQQLAEISYALASGNRASLAKAAHKFKGASANIHAHGLKFLAQQIESESAAGGVDTLRRFDTLIRQEFERARQFLTDPSVVPQPSKAVS
jgi:HPt (histidine-containing phosphotransfer) domain-containing protein